MIIGKNWVVCCIEGGEFVEAINLPLTQLCDEGEDSAECRMCNTPHVVFTERL